MANQEPERKSRRTRRRRHYDPAEKFTQPEEAVVHFTAAQFANLLPDPDLYAFPDAPDDEPGEAGPPPGSTAQRGTSGALLNPARLWTRAEVLDSPGPVPCSPGIYAWYFRKVPPGVPVDGCLTCEGLTLLYVGIAPKHPPANGRPGSSQTLRHSIRCHFRGNAEGSTLRLTLGCLLAEHLGIELRRVGSGKRMTFAAGEAKLSAWMADNALVAWLEHAEPWVLEEQLIRSVSLPLNLDQNGHHAFHAALSAMRAAAKTRAQRLPVA
jgi:hypothetical protein